MRNIRTRKLLHTLKGHSLRVTSLAISKNGNKLISSGTGGEILLWDMQTGKLIHTLKETSVDEFVYDDESGNNTDSVSSVTAIALLLSAMGGIWLTRRAMQPIESSFERLKQFTANASHELRSPLMAIKTNADNSIRGIKAERLKRKDFEGYMTLKFSARCHTPFRIQDSE